MAVKFTCITMQCPQCGTTVHDTRDAKTVTPGSTWLELLLWIVVFPLGLIYSIWRMVARYKNGCPACEHQMYAVGGYVPRIES